MIWQRPTSWSAETVDGTWYAERDPLGSMWTLHKLRGRGKGVIGRFRGMKAAMEAAK